MAIKEDVKNNKNDLNANNKPKKAKKRYRVIFWCVCFWEWLKRIFGGKVSIYHRKGSHIITGYPGSGKTLLSNKLINDANNEKIKDAENIIRNTDSDKYFFITNIDEYFQENVYTYNIFDLFKDGKQIKRLPIIDHKGRKLYGLILDEINLKFNKRLNRSKDYNNSFIGLIELIITHRHQGIPRIYFIGQKLELQDGQLQSLFKYWHNIIYSKQKPIWNYYKDNKGYIVAPKKLYIENYVKSYNDEYLQEEIIDQVKIKYLDLISYNTLGLKDYYEELPILRKEKEINAN